MWGMGLLLWLRLYIRLLVEVVLVWEAVAVAVTVELRRVVAVVSLSSATRKTMKGKKRLRLMLEMTLGPLQRQ